MLLYIKTQTVGYKLDVLLSMHDKTSYGGQHLLFLYFNNMQQITFSKTKTGIIPWELMRWYLTTLTYLLTVRQSCWNLVLLYTWHQL